VWGRSSRLAQRKRAHVKLDDIRCARASDTAANRVLFSSYKAEARSHDRRCDPIRLLFVVFDLRFPERIFMANVTQRPIGNQPRHERMVIAQVNPMAVIAD